LSQIQRYLPSEKGFWDPAWYLPNLKIRTKMAGLQPFNLLDHQMLMVGAVRRAYAQERWICHVKARQTGSSTFFTGIVYQNISSRRGCWGAILAHKKGTAKNLAEMANRYWRTSPPWLKPERYGRAVKTLEFPKLDSRLDVAAVKDDEPLRGDTIQILLATELSSWADVGGDDAWVAARNAVPSKNGLIIAESTPRYEGDQLHSVIEESELPGSKWMTLFIPWTLITEYQQEPPPGWRENTVVREYRDSFPQVTDAQAFWMQSEGLPKCKNQLERFKSEYPITLSDCWFLSASTIYDLPRLREMERRIDGGSGLLAEVEDAVVYEQPKKGHVYVVVCDPAGSWAEKDYFGAVVLDCTECAVVADFQGHRNAFVMAKMLAGWAREYNEAVVFVEANGVGEAVLTHLIDNPNIAYRNTFHRKPSQFTPGSSKLVPGWWSSDKTKRQAEGDLQVLLADGSIHIPSLRIIKQLLKYKGDWGRRARDERGGHYDLAQAVAMAAWAYRRSQSTAWGQAQLSEAEKNRRAWDRLMQELGMGGSSQNTPFGEHL
jgi:hypothetical protein